MLWFGAGATRAAGVPFSVFDLTVWRLAFGAVGGSVAGSGQVLFMAALVGTSLALGLAVSQRFLTLSEGLAAWTRGIALVWPAVLILILAWAMKSIADVLHTDVFLASLLGGRVSPLSVPLVTFGLAAGIAFATGTSWGTMGIVLPLAVPLAYSLSAGQTAGTDCVADRRRGVGRRDFWRSLLADQRYHDPVGHRLGLRSAGPRLDPGSIRADLYAAGRPAGYCGVAWGLPVWAAYALLVLGTLAVLFVVGGPCPTRPVTSVIAPAMKIRRTYQNTSVPPTH